MVEVVRLKRGERPGNNDYLLIRATRGRHTEVVEHPRGVTVRIPADLLETEVENFRRAAEANGISSIYVRGLENKTEGG